VIITVTTAEMTDTTTTVAMIVMKITAMTGVKTGGMIAEITNAMTAAMIA
jgi:hypothetical protein